MGRNKNLAFEDKKEKFSRNDFSTAKSCNIIPHPMTLLIAFPLQVIVSCFILHCLLLLTYHRITYLLPSSHILSPHVHHTCHLHPFSLYKRCTPYLSRTRSSPPFVSLCISLRISSELSSRVLITLFVLLIISCPHLHKIHQHSPLSITSTIACHLLVYPIVIHIIPMLYCI
jgi:hypothetical protein